jgi:hypothetical protein
MFEMKILLADILRNFNIRSSCGMKNVVEVWDATLKPKSGARINLTER